MSREEMFTYYHSRETEQLFEVKETKLPLPETARIFEFYLCECCGEKTGANWIRISEGKKLCLDCYTEYDRLNV